MGETTCSRAFLMKDIFNQQSVNRPNKARKKNASRNNRFSSEHRENTRTHRFSLSFARPSRQMSPSCGRYPNSRISSKEKKLDSNETHFKKIITIISVQIKSSGCEKKSEVESICHHEWLLNIQFDNNSLSSICILVCVEERAFSSSSIEQLF